MADEESDCVRGLTLFLAFRACCERSDCTTREATEGRGEEGRFDWCWQGSGGAGGRDAAPCMMRSYRGSSAFLRQGSASRPRIVASTTPLSIGGNVSCHSGSSLIRVRIHGPGSMFQNCDCSRSHPHSCGAINGSAHALARPRSVMEGHAREETLQKKGGTRFWTGSPNSIRAGADCICDLHMRLRGVHCT